MFKIEPLDNRVVIKVFKADEVSKGGLYLPNISQERPNKGDIIAIGPGSRDDKGKLIPMRVKLGQKVLFGKYSGVSINDEDGDEIVIMSEDDLLALLP